MKLQETFGETVKNLRLKKKLTLRKVAKELGIDTSMLGKIEKNNRKPTNKLIEKFADLFDVSGKELKIAFLSDTVAYQVMEEDGFANEVLKVAEKKVKYLKTKKTS
jgi:HTH-type transcriptional regulator, competence development regulator